MSRVGKLQKGTVCGFNEVKNFGFVKPEGGSGDVFFHGSAAGRSRVDVGYLKVGTKVYFTTRVGRDGRSEIDLVAPFSEMQFLVFGQVCTFEIFVHYASFTIFSDLMKGCSYLAFAGYQLLDGDEMYMLYCAGEADGFWLDMYKSRESAENLHLPYDAAFEAQAAATTARLNS